MIMNRLLYGIFIISSMASLAYDIPPMFSITQDLDIELLDEEKRWEAGNRGEWIALQEQRTYSPVSLSGTPLLIWFLERNTARHTQQHRL